jgi:hypothetical protein
MSATRSVSFFPGDATLTKLVNKLAKQQGLTVERMEQWNGYGYQVHQYRVDEAVYQEALATIEKKRAIKEAPLRQVWEEELARRFPRLNTSVPYGATVYERADEIPIDQMTRTDWRRLGRRVTAVKPRCYLVTGGGTRIIPIYSRWDVEEIPSSRSKWTGERLWKTYQARGLSVAHAIRAANRLAKLFPENRRPLYRLKDLFLNSHQHHLVEGRFVRTETSPCWSCNGGNDWCYRCSGTGVFRKRKLYEHILDFDGEAYSFHSYVEPRRLGETTGADLPRYGRRLTPKDKIPYRIAEYLRMLSHLAESWKSD